MAKTTNKILSFFLFFILLTSIAYAKDTITIVIDDSYEQKKAFLAVTQILSSLKKGQRALLYDVNHEQIIQINVDFEYKPRIWPKAYKKELSTIARAIKNMGASAEHNDDFSEHVSFLARKNNELKHGKNNQGNDKFESVILSDINDKRLNDFSTLNPDADLGGLVFNKENPFYVPPKTFLGTTIHVQAPKKSNNIASLTKNCRFWRIFIEAGAGTLGSCQTEAIPERLMNPSVYEPRIPEKEINKNIDMNLAKGIWSDKSYTELNTNTTHIPNTIMILTDPVTEKEPLIVKTNLYKLPLQIDLYWTGRADLDLSIRSDEGRVHFNSQAKFASFQKISPTHERLTLTKIPKNAYLRIVHATGKIPKTVKLTMLDKHSKFYEYSAEEIMDAFNSPAEYRNQENIHRIKLEDFIKGTPQNMASGIKPRY